VNFLQEVYARLQAGGETPVMRHGPAGVQARELLAAAQRARPFLRASGIGPGDRVVLYGDNSAHWTALDLAVAWEGALVVPLFGRLGAEDIAVMISDCGPSLVLCDTDDRLAAVERVRSRTSGSARFADAVEAGSGDDVGEPVPREADDPVRVVYTSGTSGRPKGVVLTAGGVDFVLARTDARLERLVRGLRGQERVFHYLPFCFAGSWILMLNALRRGALLTLCADLKKLGDELHAADPHYCLNVPLVLERVRRGVEELVGGRGGLVAWLWRRPLLARWLLNPAIRRQLAPSLRAFICGSAPLAEETQRFFQRLGMPVLQVYGLTETTAICTMDEPGDAVPGRVGRAIDGCEMKKAGDGEILVRGPNVFRGYWGRAPHEGWLATGDIGDRDEQGRWRVMGRKKNLIVLASGHNVAPEPLEQRLRLALPDSPAVVVVGDGRPALGALVFGTVRQTDVEAVLDAQEGRVPDHHRVRRFAVIEDEPAPGNGLLTANGKLRREAVEERYRDRIEEMFR